MTSQLLLLSFVLCGAKATTAVTGGATRLQGLHRRSTDFLTAGERNHHIILYFTKQCFFLNYSIDRKYASMEHRC